MSNTLTPEPKGGGVLSWLDEAPVPVALETVRAPDWPLVAVLILSGAGVLLAAILRSFVWSLAAYGVLIAVGCGLLYYHRRLAIAATRRAGGSGYLAIMGLERVTIGALALGCLTSGLVIAFEVARWDWGA